jgi:ubiquinone/menaquinone biosynthesis C-methylase UbiE
VAAAHLADRVSVAHGDILELNYADDTFDVVIAEAVTMFVDRRRAAAELARVTRPGGKVLATEFLWRQPPTPEARQSLRSSVTLASVNDLTPAVHKARLMNRAGTPG